MAYKSLTDVLSSLQTNENITSGDSHDPYFEEALSNVLQMLRSKLDGPQIISFSCMTEEDLSKLNIIFGGSLNLKGDYEDRMAVTLELGKTEHWSSDDLYRHLCVLQKLIPRENEAASRAWIDSFFFRASAMVPQGEQLVLSLKQNVPATGGYIDYTAVRTSVLDAETFLNMPSLQRLEGHNHTLFVSEAKTYDIPLEGHIPQALGEMYACAKLRKSIMIIRGAVTNGHDWIFLILKLNANGDGAVYARSLKRIRLMTVVPPGVAEVTRVMCNVIAGIIAYWIEHCDKDIGDDDWFDINWR